MLKKAILFTVVSAMSLSLPLQAGAAAAPNHISAQLSVQQIKAKALEYGISIENFDPNELITEDQLVKYLMIALFPETKSIFLAKTFYDLTQEEQFQKTMEYAIQAGLIAKNELQSSEEPITAQRALSIISRALELDQKGKDNHLILKDLGFTFDQYGLTSKLSINDALSLIDQTKKVYGPVQEYLNYMKEAQTHLDYLTQLTSSSSNSELKVKVKQFTERISQSVSSPGHLGEIKSGLAEIGSLAKTFAKSDWREITKLSKIKSAIEDANKKVKLAQEALDRAKSQK